MKRIKDLLKWLLAAVMRSSRLPGDWFFEAFGYHDWEYEVYDYYGNYRTKRVWRLKIFSKVYTRNYDDYFA